MALSALSVSILRFLGKRRTSTHASTIMRNLRIPPPECIRSLLELKRQDLIVVSGSATTMSDRGKALVVAIQTKKQLLPREIRVPQQFARQRLSINAPYLPRVDRQKVSN